MIKISATLDYSRSILEGTIRLCTSEVCQSKMETKKPFHKVVQSILVLFAGCELRVILRLSAINMRIPGAKRGRSSLADVEM